MIIRNSTQSSIMAEILRLCPIKEKKKQVSYDDRDMSSIGDLNPTWNLEEMDSWTCSDSYLVVIV